jgi:hypothetical protein
MFVVLLCVLLTFAQAEVGKTKFSSKLNDYQTQ